jgi:DHA2 family multidrug resistance protein
MGSSIGIAAITTALAHREAVHRSALVEHFSVGRSEVADRMLLFQWAFTPRTADAVHAHQQALSAMDQIINGQALLLSFADVFFYVAIAFVVSLPLLLLLGRGGSREAAAAAH